MDLWTGYSGFSGGAGLAWTLVSFKTRFESNI